jgi:hypothetical protein
MCSASALTSLLLHPARKCRLPLRFVIIFSLYVIVLSNDLQVEMVMACSTYSMMKACSISSFILILILEM